MENKYRLLDVGESIQEGDESLAGDGKWTTVHWPSVGSIDKTPIRRLDDGKGKYLLCERPHGADMAELVKTSFWRWGVGWVCGSGCNDSSVWRTEREVEKPSELKYSWVVMSYQGCMSFPTEADARADAEAHARKTPGIEYQVQHIRTVAKYVVELVVKEVTP